MAPASSDRSSSEESGEDGNAADPREVLLARSRAPASAAAAANAVAQVVDASPTAARAAAADSPAAAPPPVPASAREGTPEPLDAAEEEAWGGMSLEMRRLLRQPRYFDEDYEAAGQRCFRCGAGGHRERDCLSAPRERPCFLCGLFGHVSRECPNELCFNCARPGHQSRDCREPRGAAAATARCLRCGSQSHTVASCERDYDEEDMERMTCYLCGDPGHLCCEPAPREEDLPQNLSCFRCGDEGHAGFGCSARLAPSLGGGRSGGQVAECFRCGGRGHLARDCPRANMGAQGMGIARPAAAGREAVTPRQEERGAYGGGGGGRGGSEGRPAHKRGREEEEEEARQAKYSRSEGPPARHVRWTAG